MLEPKVGYFVHTGISKYLIIGKCECGCRTGWHCRNVESARYRLIDIISTDVISPPDALTGLIDLVQEKPYVG